MKVHTHKHDGKYEEAGSQADIEQSENDSGQNAAGADRSKEQQQPSERGDGSKAAQTALAVTHATPARLRSRVTQAAPALTDRRRRCAWRPADRTKRRQRNVPRRL